MGDGAGTIARVLLALAIIIIILNDAAVVATNYWLADDFARSIAEETARVYRTSGEKQQVALESAYQLCEQKQSKLTGFAIENNVVVVEIETTPKKTLLAHYIKYLTPYLAGRAIARSSSK